MDGRALSSLCAALENVGTMNDDLTFCRSDSHIIAYEKWISSQYIYIQLLDHESIQLEGMGAT